MTNGSKLNLAHHLRSSRRIHQVVSRLGSLPVALRATNRLRMPLLKPPIASLHHPRTASVWKADGSPSRTPKLTESKTDSGKSSPVSQSGPAVDWWSRLEHAVVAVEGLKDVYLGYTKVGSLWNIIKGFALRVYQPMRRAEELDGLEEPSLLEGIAAAIFKYGLMATALAPAALRLLPPIATNPWVWLAASTAIDAYVAYKYRREIVAFLAKFRDALETFATALFNYVEIAVASIAIEITNAFGRALRTEIWRPLRPNRYLGSQSLNRDGAGDLTTGHLQSRLITLQRAAVIATLAMPLVAAPSLAAIPATRGVGDGARTPSIVINSMPTVVVNSQQSGDIERQVIEALRQHREALYEQWHREVQRRQRTEF